VQCGIFIIIGFGIMDFVYKKWKSRPIKLFKLAENVICSQPCPTCINTCKAQAMYKYIPKNRWLHFSKKVFKCRQNKKKQETTCLVSFKWL